MHCAMERAQGFVLVQCRPRDRIRCIRPALVAWHRQHHSWHRHCPKGRSRRSRRFRRSRSARHRNMRSTCRRCHSSGSHRRSRRSRRFPKSHSWSCRHRRHRDNSMCSRCIRTSHSCRSTLNIPRVTTRWTILPQSPIARWARCNSFPRGQGRICFRHFEIWFVCSGCVQPLMHSSSAPGRKGWTMMNTCEYTIMEHNGTYGTWWYKPCMHATLLCIFAAWTHWHNSNYLMLSQSVSSIHRNLYDVFQVI